MRLKNILNEELDLNELQSEDFINNPINYSAYIVQQTNDGIYDFVKPLVNKDSILLDIGANIGYFSFYLSPIVKEIHAFEPTPKTFSILTRMKEVGNLTNVVLHNKAVSMQDGKTTFHLYEQNQTMNSLKEIENMSSKKIEVETKSLLNFVNQFEIIDFVKLDIEGGEKAILLHDEFDNVAKKIKNIFVEIHDFDTFGTPSWSANMEINIENAIKVLKLNDFNVTRISYDGLLATK